MQVEEDKVWLQQKKREEYRVQIGNKGVPPILFNFKVLY